jgi:hypothetical protein
VNKSDAEVLNQIITGPDAEEISRHVVHLFYCVLHRIKSTRDLEKDGIVNRAYMSLLARLKRELAGNLEEGQKHYGNIPIVSEDFSRIAYQFLLNSIHDLNDQERRHFRKRRDKEDVNNVSDNRPVEVPLERQEEISERRAQVDEILRICSPSEKRVLEELLKAEDWAQAAKHLDMTVNYLHNVLSRIRRRIREST